MIEFFNQKLQRSESQHIQSIERSVKTINIDKCILYVGK